ncbi:hypothetical protein ACFLQ2_05230 [archaeon]
MRSTLLIVVVLVALAGCTQEVPEPTFTQIATPVATPVATPTPAPTATPTATPEPTVEPNATATPTPEPTPVPLTWAEVNKHCSYYEMGTFAQKSEVTEACAGYCESQGKTLGSLSCNEATTQIDCVCM